MIDVGIQTTMFGGDVEVRRAALKKRLAGLVFSEALPNPTLRVLSMGLGLQSVTLALMSARGDLPMLDAAIFADTGHEKRATYAYLEWLRPLLPFPILVERRAGATLGEHALASVALPKQGRQQLPFHTVDGEGMVGMLPKQCNSDWKKRVVQRAIARLVREKTGAHRLPSLPVVEEWLGMTLDELERLSTSEKRYVAHRYPLVEEPFRFKRAHCTPWLVSRGYRIPPRSACIWCPFQTNDEWRDLRDDHPADLADAQAFDSAVRVPYVGFEGQAFVHRQRVPLDQVDFSTPEDHGQGSVFGCGDGVCGT